ncbi:MAG: leucine-rich repeat protein [Clostridia bacterium]|nr:leucine-rich repeat protein [Clostridia bacterium]
METKKVLSIIFSLLFVGAFAFVLVWGITNFNKVQEGLSGTGLYTQEDLNKAYEDGYDKALTDKAEYEELINSYRDTITTLTDQVTLLTYANQDCETQIKNLTETKQGLETQVANLTSIKNQNEATITSLNAEIVSLEKQVKTLTESNEDKDEEIAVLKNQIANLQALISQLQTTNALNVETINSLNAQITNLNAQISDLTMQLQNNSSNVIALQNRIAELERTVAYYEQYIANLENGEQVVATFEFAGSVYNIQILAKNSIATVTTPTSTDYVIFNYWTVDGVQVDLSTYQVQTNTRFVANVTYKYDVKFMVNNELYNSQVVVKNGYPTIPEVPTMEGYEFDGWTTNGVDIVNPNTTAITVNTTYYAKFTQLHTVTFMYEDQVVDTQQVRNGNYASAVSVENTTYKTFNGWLLNGTKVDLSTYKITGAETFVADIIYSYDVEFMVDDAVYNTQVISKNGKASLPANPTKSGYMFECWTLNGAVVNPETVSITGHTKFVARFIQNLTVTFTVDGSTFETTSVAKNGYATINSNPTKNGFNFLGWSVDGSTIIDLASYPITENTEFIAVFSMQAGLFVNGAMTRTWNDLVTSGDIVVEGTTIVEGGNEELVGDLVISSAITYIDYMAFRGFWKLTSVTFGDNSQLTGLSDSVFENCRDLVYVDFGKNSKLTDLGYCTFRCATSLKEIVIPSGVTSLGNYVFAECYDLERVDFNGAKITSIGQDAFYECQSLKELIIPNTVKSIGDYAFEYCAVETLIFEEGSQLAKIYEYGFYGAYNLTEFRITSNVTSIGEEAFAECESLTTLYIDSATIASMTSDSSYIFTNVTTVYLKQGLSTALVSSQGFAKSGTTADGYDIYTI